MSKRRFTLQAVLNDLPNWNSEDWQALETFLQNARRSFAEHTKTLTVVRGHRNSQLADLRNVVDVGLQIIDARREDDVQTHIAEEHRLQLEGEVKAQQAAQQAALETRIASLTPNQRILGLAKWGIIQVMAEDTSGKTTATPATRILLDRMQPHFDGDRLSGELRAVYLELRQKYDDDNNRRQSIAYLVSDKVVAVPWENGTTRL